MTILFLFIKKPCKYDRIKPCKYISKNHVNFKGKQMAYNQLNEDEKRVILQKGTERSFTGKYWDHHEDGMYVCRQCNAKLFPSDTKFDSGTGWPSFDDAVEGAVREVPDADGRRVEIVCANCGGHLGHVFKGEGMTPKSTRHCVNSISLDFVAKS
jgi:methionine-R-sulfoxide reductase